MNSIFISNCVLHLIVGFILAVHVTGDNVNNQVPSFLKINKLIDDPKCPKLKIWCSELPNGNDDDISVLECLQSISTIEIHEIKKDCQQAIRSHIERILEDVPSILHESCGNEIEHLNCKTSSDNGEYFACILENRDEIKSEYCIKDIQRLEAIAFYDLQWITQFLQACKNDLDNFQCNRQEANVDFLFKGQSLICLQQNIKDLQSKCKSQVLKLTEIQADNIKLDPELYLACSAERLRFCRDLQPGTGLIFKCLMQHRSDKISAKCEEKLFKRQKLITQDFKISKGMMKACREDIRKSHCRKQISDDKTIRLAQILLCLENYVRNGTKVSPSCEGEMIDQRKILMEDYRLSPEIVDGCSNDIRRFCDQVVNGRTIHCLMEHAKPRNRERKISDRCQRALEDLIKETDAGEDWRVDPVLREACQPIVNRACRDLRGGDARVMSCLMDNLGTDIMTEDCESALVQIQYFVARDFKLDPQLYRSCKEDAYRLCHAKKSWSSDANYDPDNAPLILPCLYRYANYEEQNREIREQKREQDLKLKPICLEQIRRVMRQRAISVDLQPEIEEKCIDDLSLLCFDKTEKGAEMNCLQMHLQDLNEQCKAAVANFTEVQAQRVDLNPVIMTHCGVIIDRHCKTKKDEGDVMECLIQHKNDPDVKSDNKCRAAIEHFQLISLKNYHFTYKFKLSCKPYVIRYCQDSRTKGDVIACLSEIVRNDTLMGNRNKILKDCRQQLRSQLLQQRENIDFDTKLKESCKSDILRYCKNTEHGSAKVLECLKEVPNEGLTVECQKQMFKVRTQDMIDNSIDYTLVTMCQSMIKEFCDTAEPARVLDCLKNFKDDANFDKRCKHVVIHRLIEQTRDYRFNPKLKAACNVEIGKFCSHILKKQMPDHELDGKVTECLKKQFRKSMLTSKCETEMTEILREQALNYQLNPLLKAVCSADIEALCKSNADDQNSGTVEECLKNALLEKRIMSPSCKNEVATLIEESEADIHVDPLLQKACTKDLLQYCSDVKQGGGKLLKCLQITMSDLDKPMESDCKHMLTKRLEMFRNAAALVEARPPDDLGQLYAQVVASPAKRYFMISALTIIGLIFFAGLFCGRVTRRARVLKNKPNHEKNFERGANFLIAESITPHAT